MAPCAMAVRNAASCSIGCGKPAKPPDVNRGPLAFKNLVVSPPPLTSSGLVTPLIEVAVGTLPTSAEGSGSVLTGVDGCEAASNCNYSK